MKLTDEDVKKEEKNLVRLSNKAIETKIEPKIDITLESKMEQKVMPSTTVIA